MSNAQFILLGAVLGCLATLMYWQVAKMCQRFRSSFSRNGDEEDPACCLDDPNKHLFLNCGGETQFRIDKIDSEFDLNDDEVHDNEEVKEDMN